MPSGRKRGTGAPRKRMIEVPKGREMQAEGEATEERRKRGGHTQTEIDRETQRHIESEVEGERGRRGRPE